MSERSFRRQLTLDALGIEIAGPAALEPVARPFERLAPGDDRDAPVDLRIGLLDAGDVTLRAEQSRASFHQGTIFGRGVDGGFLLSGPGFRVEIDPGGRAIRTHVARAADRVTPVALFLAFTIALRWHGRFHLHAAGLVDARGDGVIVAGQSRSGKSTVASTLVEAGYLYLADDALFVRRADVASGGGCVVAGFPRVFHLDERSAAGLPASRASLGATCAVEPRKRELDPWMAFPGQHVPRAERARALIFPRIVDEEATRAAPMPGAEALGALVEASAMLVVDGMPAVPEQLAVLGDLVTGARAFSLALGRDALGAPGVLIRVVDAALRAE